MPRLNDPRLEENLERDGYAVVDDFLGATEIARLLESFKTHDSPLHRQGFGATMVSNDLAYRAAVDRDIKDAFGSRADGVFNGYRHCFSNFLVKAPQPANAGPQAGEVALHQDITLVDESRYQALNLWCPLVDTDVTNGCLLVAPGTERLNAGPRGPGTPFPYRELAKSFKLRAVPMKAGSAMIFGQKLIHASPPNRSTATRVVVAGLFAPREAQLLCCYPDAELKRMEVFAVDDLFYTRYIYRTRPEGVPRIGVIDYWHAPLTARQLAG
jgi:ectoine hydroxylase-related dioxygenase (phytanoyl-CoA dioxygenase family)